MFCCSLTQVNQAISFKDILSPTFFMVYTISTMSLWISSHMHSKVWNEITYPFPTFNGCTVEVWEWVSYFIPNYNGWNYLSLPGLQFIHFSQRGPQIGWTRKSLHNNDTKFLHILLRLYGVRSVSWQLTCMLDTSYMITSDDKSMSQK